MTSERPNILIIMADQLTAALTGAYGHPVVKTPALDRLCAEGVRFDAAYTNCPLCAPARAAMLTGRYASRTRTYDNASALPDDAPTFAHHLRAAGYEVVASGKMHMIGADQLHGFERRFTTDIYPASFAWTPSWREYEMQGIPKDKRNLADAADVCDWNTHLTYDTETQFRALEFLRQRGRQAKSADWRPFCLVVSYTHPHPPYLVAREWWDLYEAAPIDTPAVPERPLSACTQMDRWLYDYEGIPPEIMRDAETMRRMRRAYYGMVSYVDSLVGELLDTLEAMELREETAVVFASDHGDMLGERGLVEKRCFYEWSVRVPLIARFPGRWMRGAVRSELVSLIDLCPTLIDLAGAAPPAYADGRSLLPLLEGRVEDDPDALLLAEYLGEGVAGCSFMARRGANKLTLVHGHESQLFNLENDPLETNNLAGWPEWQEVEESLRTEIEKRFDADRIDADVRRSQEERILIRDAMAQGRKTSWDYQPFFDAVSSYIR